MLMFLIFFYLLSLSKSVANNLVNVWQFFEDLITLDVFLLFHFVLKATNLIAVCPSDGESSVFTISRTVDAPGNLHIISWFDLFE